MLSLDFSVDGYLIETHIFLCIQNSHMRQRKEHLLQGELAPICTDCGV
jgi:hypothetical protein